VPVSVSEVLRTVLLVMLQASSLAKFPTLSPIITSSMLRLGMHATLSWLNASF
jgi:hypothetical protein